MKKELTQLEKAAIAWAEQRRRYLNARPLGMARARAALQLKAERLVILALEAKEARG